jgi:hypothetical protein
MKKYFLLAIPVVLIFLALSCDSSTEPEKRIKSPREMTWDYTHLTSPDSTSVQLLPENIVAFAEDDIWLVCWSDVARGLIWHYDGETWTESNIVEDVGGMRVNDIAGYRSGNLWTCGFRGYPQSRIFLAHYNGYEWREEEGLNIEGELLDMCKDPDDNLWACGMNGIVLKFDQTIWMADTIEVGYLQQYPGASYSLYSIECHSNKVIVLGAVFDFERKRNLYYIFTGDINDWHLEDSFTIESPQSENKWGNFGLYKSTDAELFSYGAFGIWEKSDSQWNKIFNLDGEVYGMYRIDPTFTIAVSAFKRIYFSNGSSWESISDLFNITDNSYIFKNVWTNGYETFIVGYGTHENFSGTTIFHGK